MKKFSKLLVLFFCVMYVISPVSFAIVANEQVSEMEKQQRINEIFTKLNDIASENIMQSYYEETLKTRYVSTYGDKMQDIKRELEDELYSLGINKIEKDNGADIDHFKEIIGDSVLKEMNDTQNTRAMPFDDLDSLVNSLLDTYEVYQYEGYRTVNGVSYPYAYYRIIDMGGGKLFATNLRGDLIGNLSMIVKDFRNTQLEMKYDLSKISSKWGAALQWVVSSVFSVLDSYEENTMLKADSTSLYYCTLATVTEMTIYYIYIEQYGIWEICGSRASNVHVKRTDTATYNYMGDPYIIHSDPYDYYFETGKVWHWYIDNHIALNRVPTHHTIGEIIINNLSAVNTYTFAPKYSKTLVGLL